MSHNPSKPSPRGSPRLQRLILRVGAVASLLALPAVVSPRMALEKLGWVMGFGEPQMTPLLVYMTAGGATVFLAVGVLLWVVSGDVTGHRPVVLLIGWTWLACGPVFLWIDWDAGLPGWWIAMDSLGCLIAGAALLWACHLKGAGPAETGGDGSRSL